MFRRMSSNSPKPFETKCKDLRKHNRLNDRIYERQVGVPGFDQESFWDYCVDIVGGGGIGGEIAEGLVRKGAGQIAIIDGGTVAMPCLNRQHFYESNLGKNKAIELAKNLQKVGFMGTTIIGQPMLFQDYVKGEHRKPDIIVCGVDNDEARASVCRYGVKHNVPVVFTAVSRDANQGYVFIQKPGEACFGCVFPDAISNKVSPCPNTPAMKDILKIVAGMVLYAIDSVLMDRQCTWNYRMFYLAGFMTDQKVVKERNPDCPICSKPEGDLSAVE